MYILAVVGVDMILDTDPPGDKEKQWFISMNNILLKFFISACVKTSIESIIHNIFINSVNTGGKDDR